MAPLSGASRPAILRRSVDFPPPLGPMSARLRSSPKSTVTSSMTRLAPKDLLRASSERRMRSSFEAGASFEPLGPERDGERADEEAVRTQQQNPTRAVSQ